MVRRREGRACWGEAQDEAGGRHEEDQLQARGVRTARREAPGEACDLSILCTSNTTPTLLNNTYYSYFVLCACQSGPCLCAPSYIHTLLGHAHSWAAGGADAASARRRLSRALRRGSVVIRPQCSAHGAPSPPRCRTAASSRALEHARRPPHQTLEGSCPRAGSAGWPPTRSGRFCAPLASRRPGRRRT